MHPALRLARHTPPLASDGLFRSVFDNTLEAIVIMDERGHVLEANAEACFLFERTVLELRSTAPSDLVDLNDPRVRDAVFAAADDGRFTGLVPLLRRDGSRFHADVSATPRGARLSMALHYSGNLWAPPLQRLLDHEIDLAKPRLAALAQGGVPAP